MAKKHPSESRSQPGWSLPLEALVQIQPHKLKCGAQISSWILKWLPRPEPTATDAVSVQNNHLLWTNAPVYSYFQYSIRDRQFEKKGRTEEVRVNLFKRPATNTRESLQSHLQPTPTGEHPHLLNAATPNPGTTHIHLPPPQIILQDTSQPPPNSKPSNWNQMSVAAQQKWRQRNKYKKNKVLSSLGPIDPSKIWPIYTISLFTTPIGILITHHTPSFF